MNKPIETTAGTVQMSDGTRRDAWKNVYTYTTCADDGSVVRVTETRIEFLLFTNVNEVRGRRYRKVTQKQADTFRADD